VDPEEIREKLKLVPWELSLSAVHLWRVPHCWHKKEKNYDKLTKMSN